MRLNPLDIRLSRSKWLLSMAVISLQMFLLAMFLQAALRYAPGGFPALVPSLWVLAAFPVVRAAVITSSYRAADAGISPAFVYVAAVLSGIKLTLSYMGAHPSGTSWHIVSVGTTVLLVTLAFVLSVFPSVDKSRSVSIRRVLELSIPYFGSAWKGR